MINKFQQPHSQSFNQINQSSDEWRLTTTVNSQPLTANWPITHRLTVQNKKKRHDLGFLAHGDAEVACNLREGDGAEDEYEKADPKPAIPMLPVGKAVANNADSKKDIYGIFKRHDQS